MRHPVFSSSSLLRAASIGILALGVACSSDSGTSSNTPSIKLALHPTAATVGLGGSVSVTGVLTRTNFTGNVTISADGIPSGVTYTVTHAASGGDSTTISLMVGTSTATGGPYTINVHAAGTGVTTSSASFALTVSSTGTDTITLPRRQHDGGAPRQ